jgi:hypothetical protein
VPPGPARKNGCVFSNSRQCESLSARTSVTSGYASKLDLLGVAAAEHLYPSELTRDDSEHVLRTGELSPRRRVRHLGDRVEVAAVRSHDERVAGNGDRCEDRDEADEPQSH